MNLTQIDYRYSLFLCSFFQIRDTAYILNVKRNTILISHHQKTIIEIKMMTTTPAPTPIAIHFQSLLFGSTGPAFGAVVGGVGLKNASISEIFAPIAASITDLCVVTMCINVP